MLIAKKDEKFKHHLEAIAAFMTNEIRDEVKKVKFISVIMDESTDASNRAQLSTVFRYVSPEGEIQERFTDVSTDRFAVSLSNYLFNILQEYKCGDKLVA